MDNAADVRADPTVIVVTGGAPPNRDLPSLVPADAFVIAADSGADTALALGLTVDALVGDLDSVSAGALDAAVASGASVERHEPDKDATDLELALHIALGHHPGTIVVLGGLGGRVDHELANVRLLAAAAGGGVDVVLRSGRSTMHFVGPGRRACLRGSVGEVVSILPAAGGTGGVTTAGLRWPLDDAALPDGTTLGVSNELVAPEAEVACTSGVLLVIQPGVAAAAVPSRTAEPTKERR